MWWTLGVLLLEWGALMVQDPEPYAEALLLSPSLLHCSPDPLLWFVLPISVAFVLAVHTKLPSKGCFEGCQGLFAHGYQEVNLPGN